ncbi:MAG: Trp family transcriptional regulator [Candidatus Woesebacteria bacterium]|nr:Trp family transcriptional regulator [Candidatus Woesebacteria bacterium]
MQHLQREIINTFFQTLEDIKTKEDFRTFCKDFFSDKELETYVKRLAIAYWLKKKRSIQNIKTNLEVGTSEIELVEKQLNTKGFKLALQKMEAEEWANVWSEKIKKLAS